MARKKHRDQALLAVNTGLRFSKAFAAMTTVLDQGRKTVQEKKANAGVGQVVNIGK